MLIKLPHDFQKKHRLLIKQYLIDYRRLTQNQWWTVLEGFDLLANATIQQPTATYSFRTFYRLWVDEVYANYFLNKIITLDNPEQNGLTLQTALERQIVAQLRQLGWIDIQHTPDTLYRKDIAFIGGRALQKDIYLRSQSSVICANLGYAFGHTISPTKQSAIHLMT